MKKTILSTVLLSGLALSIAAPAASATVSQASGQAETDVKVNLKKDEGHEENNGDYFKTLAIVWKPTEFRFEGSATDADLRLLNRHDKSNRQFIAVNDDRRKGPEDDAEHAGKGWILTGKLDDLVNTADANAKLNATMTVHPGPMYVYDIGTNIYDNGTRKDYIPEAIPDPLDPNDAMSHANNAALDGALTLRPSFNMKAGGGETPFLFKANDGIELDAGKRGVLTNLGTNELRITKPSAQKVGSYEGKITWTVADQP